MTKAEHDRAYYQQNREKIRIKQKAYYQQNCEKIRTKMEAFRTAHPLVDVWHHMMQRCGLMKGASARDLTNYARRGITVCDEWRVSFKPFEEWALANGYKPGLQLDRIDNNGNYSPENCRFVTRSQNCRNRRNTVMFGGQSLAHWYDLGHVDGLNYNQFFRRFTSYHWPICRALFEPVHIKNQLNPKANSQPR